MNDLLEDLWYLYEINRNKTVSAEEKKALNALIENHEKLCVGLSDELISVLEEFENCERELACIAEKEAFIKGVRFASKFWLEAIYSVDI